MPIQNALTIDVEDYYQVTNFERQISRADWPSYPSRVVANTQRILQLLARYNVQATFFVLGYVAERHPQLVRMIDSAGHEIGSHSFWHRLVYQLTPDEFRDDVRRSKQLLEDLSGQPVTAFRSPSFSITRQSMWALEILVEEGFQVDSSIFPIRHNRYGIPGACMWPFVHQLTAGELWEFPLTVGRWGRHIHVPIAGGGYFRLFPYRFTRTMLQRVNEREAAPFVFYTHPWEFDPDQPRVRAGTALQRFRHYVNLATTEAKFERLLQTFSFGRLDDVLATYRSASERQPAGVAG